MNLSRNSFFLTFFIFFFCISASGQEIERHELKNSVSLNIIPLFEAVLHFTYERTFQSTNSMTLSPRYYIQNRNKGTDNGFGFELQYRFSFKKSHDNEYFTYHTPKFIPYFAPYFNIDKIQRIYEDYHPPDFEENMSSFGAGIVFGVKSPLSFSKDNSRLFINDTYLGIGFRKSSTISYYYSTYAWGPGYSGVLLKIGMQFGINW